MDSKICFSLLVLIYVCYARTAFPDQTDNKFQQECLFETNVFRAKHHAPALSIDQQALTYAKTRCHLVSQSKGLSHGHSGLKGFGENLFWRGGSSLGGCKAAINAWYNEESKYNYNSPGFSMSTGHFTQLVWKSSTGLGCARCGGKDGKWFETYVVCNYSPPGNWRGRFPLNVLKP